jgi:hypothetical protein
MKNGEVVVKGRRMSHWAEMRRLTARLRVGKNVSVKSVADEEVVESEGDLGVPN